MTPPEDPDVLFARIDERLKAIERDVRDIKAARPQWPVIVSSLAAVAALIVTLTLNL